MTEISFFAGELALALVWIAVRLAVWLRRRRIDWRREAALAVMYINLAVILRFVFYPMQTAGGRVQPLLFDRDAVWPFRINWTPLVHILEYDTRRELLLNIIGNVGLFLPSGIVLPLLYRKLDRFWKVAAAGAGMSLCIELLQLPFAGRATDVDDLILNTLGCMIGYGLFALVRALVQKKKPASGS